MDQNLSISITMNKGSDDIIYHSRGEDYKNTNSQQEGLKTDIYYRKMIQENKDNIYISDILSDEFINRYIPSNLNNFITWKDVLACGMVPEQRNNKGIRNDIQFDNITLDYPNTSSPSSPQDLNSSIVIEAKEINNTIKCEINEDSVITLSYNDPDNLIKYSKQINDNSNDWIDNKKYFQNDYHKFYNILDSAFNKNNNHIQWEKIEKNDKYITVKVYYEDTLFGFNFILRIMKEIDHTDILKEEINKKHKIIKDLKEKVDTLCDIINWGCNGKACTWYKYTNENRSSKINTEIKELNKKISSIKSKVAPLNPSGEDYEEIECIKGIIQKKQIELNKIKEEQFDWMEIKRKNGWNI